ncbi:MAG: hypothetical protein JWN49_134 [Parcubacteria group bacterium]|nr:hypothetical protein [Parcubacteria group bacterium]
MTTSYRTSNRQSMQFRMRMFMRKARTRVFAAFIELLESDTRLAA